MRKINLEETPFSRYGSYMAVSYMTKEFRLFGQDLHLEDGLHLRSVRGDIMSQPIIGRIVPTYKGEVIPYYYEAFEEEICISFENGEIRIAFADSNTLLVKGIGEQIGLRILDLDKGGVFDFIHEIPYKGKMLYEINLFKNQDKFICGCQKGNIISNQIWNEKTASNCSIDITEENGEFLVVIEEAKVEWSFKEFQYDYEECVELTKKEIEDFIDGMPSVPKRYEETRKKAGYTLWNNTVQSELYLTRDAVYASKNWMLGAFSWDQCFPAMALSYGEKELAWAQLMLLFDYQDKSGRIPDFVTETNAHWNYSKPPIHGWTVLRMMEQMDLSEKEMQEIYERLTNWTNWWYNYRDSDEDGCCEYYHGNDSGWDNATVFRIKPTVESPELSAFLILQEEALSILAEKLGKKEENIFWKERSEKQMADMLSHEFDHDCPVAKINKTHELIDEKCLLPYEAVILGKRLPERVQKKIVDVIKTEGFLTRFGLATESTESEYYDDDGYWRGPIWAPSTLIMLDGLYQLDQKELTEQIAEKYADMVQQSGFAENFDAKTGEGRRDRSYAWTAAVFLIAAHKYLQ